MKKSTKKVTFSNSVVAVAKEIAKAIKGKVEVTNAHYSVAVKKGKNVVVRLGRWERKDREKIMASVHAPFTAGGKAKFPNSHNEKWFAPALLKRGMVALTKSIQK